MTSPRSSESSAREGWWAWPGVWGLDAALVAVAWQHAAAEFFGVALFWQARAALALTVIAVYITDRLLDGQGNSPDSLSTLRHQLPARSRALHLLLIAAASAGALWLTLTTQPPMLVIGGMALLLSSLILLGTGNPSPGKTRWWRVITLLIWAALFGLFASVTGLARTRLGLFWSALFLTFLLWRMSRIFAETPQTRPAPASNLAKGLVFAAGSLLAPVILGPWQLADPGLVYGIPLLIFALLAAHSMEVVDEDSGVIPRARFPVPPALALALAGVLVFLFPQPWGVRFGAGLASAAIAVTAVWFLAPSRLRPILTDVALLLPAAFFIAV